MGMSVMGLTGNILLLAAGIVAVLQSEHSYTEAQYMPRVPYFPYDLSSKLSAYTKTESYSHSGSGWKPRVVSSYSGGNYGNSEDSYWSRSKPTADKRLTQLDKLYARAQQVQDQLRSYSRQLQSLQTRTARTQRQSLQDKESRRSLLAADLGTGGDKLDDFKDDVTKRLAPGVSQLRARNEENQAQVGQVRALLARQRASDVTQGTAIASLLLALRNWKRDSPEATAAAVDPALRMVAAVEDQLQAVTARLANTTCESGRVTLEAGDRNTFYAYQSAFTTKPHIIYGICSFHFNLDSRGEPPLPQYWLPYEPTEPNSLGVRAEAFSSRTGLSVELLDLSFGDTSLVSADVCFQACSTIG